jgi:hypothetical protein
MRTNSKSVVNVAGAGALALLMATSAFAAPQRGNDQRSNDRRGNDNGGWSQSQGQDRGGSYRDNQRVNGSGRVTSLSRDNGGYRVQLDRGRDWYYIPASHMRNRGNDLRVGVSIILGGIFRGGRIDVDAVSWPGDRGYRDDRGGYGYGNNDEIRGVVERVDYRSGVLLLRESSTGRTIDVDMRDTTRSSRVDLNDLRRGDRITLTGQWQRGGNFDAQRIESVSTGRR